MQQAPWPVQEVSTALQEVERLERALAERELEAESGPRVAELRFRLAQLCFGHASGAVREKALVHLRSLWHSNPTETGVRLLFTRCLEEKGDTAELAEVCLLSAEAAEDPLEKAELYGRAGEILLALGAPERVLEILSRPPPEDEVAHRHRLQCAARLEAWFAEKGRVEEAVSVCRRFSAELRGEKRFDELLRLAQRESRLGDEAATMASLRAALSEKPAAMEAMEPLVRFLEEKGDAAGVAEVLQRTASALGSPSERAKIWRRLAEHCEGKLGDPSRSLQCWWHAWEENPEGAEAMQLKRLCTELQQWEVYQHVLLRELQRAEDVLSKVEIYRELATFRLEVLGDEAGAAASYGSILQLIPDDESALGARLQIARRRGPEEAEIIALRRYASCVKDPCRRDELLRSLARLEFRRGEREGSLQILGRLGAAEAPNRELVQELWQKTSAEGETALALTLGRLRVRMASEAQEDLTVRLALILALAEDSRRAGENGWAAICYRQALELQPHQKEARAALTELSEKKPLVDVTAVSLALQAERMAEATPRRAVRLLLQAVQIARQGNGDDGEAAAKYLRRAVTLCPPRATEEYPLLEEALRAFGLHQELAGLLQREAEGMDTVAERRNILRALARVYHQDLRRPVQAAGVLEQILALDPRNAEVAEELRFIYGQLESHGSLAQVLESLLTQTSGRARIPLLEELGWLYGEKLRDDASALRCYGELLSLSPDHGQALSFCRRHDEAAGNFRAIAVLLCRAAEAAEDPLRRAEFHHEIALIAEEHLNDFDFSIAQWRRVVELCPADAAPRGELRRLLAKTARWRELEAALLSEVSRSLRPEDKVPVYRELAQVAQHRLKEDRVAAGYIRLALQLAPGQRELLSELTAIYERLGLWHELATTLRYHAEAETDVEEKVKLLHRAARILMVRLKREEDALSLCFIVRALRPGDRVAATLMGEIFGKRGQSAEHIELLREQLDEESDPLELGRLHLELGHLLLEKGDDVEGAAHQFDRALQLDEGRGEVLPILRRLYETLGRWDLLIDLLHRRISDESSSHPERVAILCEVGRIREEHQDDLDGAREAYERALQIDAHCLPALRALRASALIRGQWREFVALARREVQVLEEPFARANLLFEIGKISQEKLAQPAAAREALGEALDHDPGNTRAAERLADLCFEEEEWERTSALLKQVIESTPEPKNVHELYYKLGCAHERCGREEEAFSGYVKSFGKEPMYLPTLERLVDLCYDRRQWDNTFRIAEAIVTTYEEQKNPQELAMLHLRMGLCELHLAQRDAAMEKLRGLVLSNGQEPMASKEAWQEVAESWAATPLEEHLLPLVNKERLQTVLRSMERALSYCPDFLEPLQVTAAIQLALDDWERGLRALERAAGAAKQDRKSRVALLICAGDVAAHGLCSSKRAEGYYQEALSISPGSPLAVDRLDMLQVTPSLSPLPLPPSMGPLPLSPSMGPLPLPPPAAESSARITPPPVPKAALGRVQTKPLPLVSTPPASQGHEPTSRSGAAPQTLPPPRLKSRDSGEED